MSASVQGTRRRQQREQTWQLILPAAERFLRERPYRELSVEALMADTGFTRTTWLWIVAPDGAPASAAGTAG